MLSEILRYQSADCLHHTGEGVALQVNAKLAAG